MAIWAIGDVHGQADALQHLVHSLPMERNDTLLLLGDLVDRGPQSASVVDYVRHLAESMSVTTLRGNHEAMMLESRHCRHAARRWLDNGGDQTLASYQLDTVSEIPTEDWEFVERTKLYHETEDCIYVHAGLDPILPIEEQLDQDLLWRTFDRAAAHISGKFMLCGHTTQKEGLPALGPNSICIDTFHPESGGWLTAINLSRHGFWQSNSAGDSRCDSLVVLTE